MALQNLIAHRLLKSSPSTAGQPRLRPAEIPRDGKVEELCRELKNTYIRKAGKQYGSFGPGPLPGWLREWLEGRLGFVGLSNRIAQHLLQQFDAAATPLDNILVMLYETAEAGDALYLFLVDHKAAHYFDGELDLCDALFLDTANINLGAKIKTAEFMTATTGNYLSLLRWRGEKELSEAFAAALGLAEPVDTSADTSEFLDLVTHYTAAMPEDVARTTRRQAVEYCLQQDKAGLPVQMAEVALHISQPDQPHFSHFVSTTQPEGKSAWIADRAQLKNYVRISGRDEQLSMSFASACLGSTVVYDRESDSITIKNIPASLKAKLLEHLQKNRPHSDEREGGA